jgi:hypothetical protein
MTPVKELSKKNNRRSHATAEIHYQVDQTKPATFKRQRVSVCAYKGLYE